MSDNTLRPCPFCGGAPVLKKEGPFPPELADRYWVVSCPEKNPCTLWPMAMGDSRDEAISNWNSQRVIENVEAALVKAIAAARETLLAIHGIHRAFGAPGDFGYDTNRGKALLALFNSSQALASVVPKQ